jgi:hypothetical protein
VKSNSFQRLLLAVSGGAVLIGGGWILAAQAGKPVEKPPGLPLRTLVERLDRFVQRRFRTVEEMFGMNRIATGSHNFWKLAMDPESEALTKEFARAGVLADVRTVSVMRRDYSWGTPVKPMYTGVTRIGVPVKFRDRAQMETGLRNSPGTYHDIREVGEGRYHQSLSWPEQVATNWRSEPESPDFPELRPGIAESIAALRTAPSHSFRAGRWEVFARPIKAGMNNCLSCHSDAKGRPAKLNETLGLVLYITHRIETRERVASR